MKKNLNTKEKLFCVFYSAKGNTVEAAALAGFDDPCKDGNTLLAREDIIEYISSVNQKKLEFLSRKAVTGYERLAFGSFNDAVGLLFSDSPSKEDLSSIDLFNVAEIKRPKEGAMEIKFFDRIKALEKLEMLDHSQQNSTSDFYNAIVNGIKNSQSDDGGGSE